MSKDKLYKRIEENMYLVYWFFQFSQFELLNKSFKILNNTTF